MKSLAKLITAPREAPLGKDFIDLFKDHPRVLGIRPMDGDDAYLAQKRYRNAGEEAELVE